MGLVTEHRSNHESLLGLVSPSRHLANACSRTFMSSLNPGIARRLLRTIARQMHDTNCASSLGRSAFLERAMLLRPESANFVLTCFPGRSIGLGAVLRHLVVAENHLSRSGVSRAQVVARVFAVEIPELSWASCGYSHGCKSASAVANRPWLARIRASWQGWTILDSAIVGRKKFSRWNLARPPGGLKRLRVDPLQRIQPRRRSLVH